MQARDLYKQKYEAQLHEWSAKVDELKAHSDKLTAQAKIDMLPRIETLQGKVDGAKAKLHDIATATDDKWDDVKKSTELAWNDVKAAVEGAYEAIKSHTKN